MSTGPIEFLNDVPLKDSGVSEYGGGAGLIAGGRGDTSVGGVDHELTAGEVLGVMVRAGSEPVHTVWVAGSTEAVASAASGAAIDAGAAVVDPLTGRVVDDVANKDVTGDGGSLSDLKP